MKLGKLFEAQGDGKTIGLKNVETFFLPERAVGIAGEFALFGGLLMAVGPFLPQTDGGELAQVGLGPIGLPMLAVVLSGLIVTAFAVLGQVRRRRYSQWYLPCAAATAALTFYCQLVLDGVISGKAPAGDLGLGISFCYLGAFLSFLAGAVCLARRPRGIWRMPVAQVAASLVDTGIRPRPLVAVPFEEAVAKSRKVRCYAANRPTRRRARRR